MTGYLNAWSMAMKQCPRHQLQAKKKIALPETLGSGKEQISIIWILLYIVRIRLYQIQLLERNEDYFNIKWEMYFTKIIFCDGRKDLFR